MTSHAKRSLAAIVVLLGAVIAGCGSTAAPSVPASAVLVNAGPKSPGQVILSALGAQRIGVQTALVQDAHRSTVVVPYSAVIYDPSGKPYVFTNIRPLTYVEVPITVQRISGNSAYLTAGPPAGAKVVTVGAEELYGVQTGVLAQT